MFRGIFLLVCLALPPRHHDSRSMGALHVVQAEKVPCEMKNNCYINKELEKYHIKMRIVSRSCKEIRDKYGVHEDGIYFLTTASGLIYQTFCDMTTAGGGWTLVASVHENDIYGKCGVGSRWSTQTGVNYQLNAGDQTWSNRVTFGNAEAATDDDYKNPGYYDITAEDVSVWHVPNNEQRERWTNTSILRYHTETHFLKEQGGNLFHLFKHNPVVYGAGGCTEGGEDNGPTVPVVYDLGSNQSTSLLYGPRARGEFEPGFITFRVFSSTRNAMAICSGVKPTGCNPQHYCIGAGGSAHRGFGGQCGDFNSFLWSGDGGDLGWRASREVIESAVLLFYR